MTPKEAAKIVRDARVVVAQANPVATVYGIPARQPGTPELLRPGGWQIIGWVQVHTTKGIDTMIVCCNEETGERKLKKGWAPDQPE